MKLYALTPLLLALSLAPIMAQNEVAPAEKETKQDTTKEDAKKEDAPKTPEAQNPELRPHQKAFLNLPVEERKKFVEHLTEASRLFQSKRIFECLDELSKAEKIFGDSPEFYNLRGSCFVEFRDFDKAMADYKKADQLVPNNPSIEFNIAEVLFVTKKWQEAHDAFEALLPKLPPNDIGLGRLVEFKLLLCKQKLGKKNEVIALANKYDYQDDSPYYYYAQMALAYEAKDLNKADEWLATVARIFQDPAILAPWQDTMVEFGYVKSLYGEDTLQSGTEKK